MTIELKAQEEATKEFMAEMQKQAKHWNETQDILGCLKAHRLGKLDAPPIVIILNPYMNPYDWYFEHNTFC